MSEKPLNVRVAEALGIKPRFQFFMSEDTSDAFCSCGASRTYGGRWDMPGDAEKWEAEHTPHLKIDNDCPRYDTDWKATGPVLTSLGLSVTAYSRASASGPYETWRAESYDEDEKEYGDTPLVAICNLVLALHAAGKLESKP